MTRSRDGGGGMRDTIIELFVQRLSDMEMLAALAAS
jgi:hypothetical protein